MLHLKSFLQEVFASFQSIAVFVRITPVPNQEHQGLKHSTSRFTHLCSVLMVPKCLQQYLERFLGDLLHRQPAIFCEKLQETNTDQTCLD